MKIINIKYALRLNCHRIHPVDNGQMCQSALAEIISDYYCECKYFPSIVEWVRLKPYFVYILLMNGLKPIPIDVSPFIGAMAMQGFPNYL